MSLQDLTDTELQDELLRRGLINNPRRGRKPKGLRDDRPATRRLTEAETEERLLAWLDRKGLSGKKQALHILGTGVKGEAS